MVLKQDHPDGSTSYRDLGNDYILIVKETSPERFKEAGLIFFGNGDTHFTGKCFALVVYNSGSVIYPLYIGFGYQIMNNKGGLFYDIGYHHGLINDGERIKQEDGTHIQYGEMGLIVNNLIMYAEQTKGYNENENLKASVARTQEFLRKTLTTN